MWHSEAGGVVVMRWLPVMGCSVRWLGLMMMAKGGPLIFSLWGCMKYA